MTSTSGGSVLTTIGDIMPKKDPLLEELEERISEGPVVFTPDEEFLERLKEKEEVQETVDNNVNNC